MATRLVNFAERQQAGVPNSLDVILGDALTVESVEFRNGDYGEYAVMDVTVETGEILRIQTGAMLILDALHNAAVADAFPLEATFVKEGRLYLVK